MPPEPLTPPVFVEVDPATLTRELIAEYEARTGRTLYPAQPERIWLDLLAYRETLLRQAIQDAATNNLVQFARGEYLDALGRLLGVTRLPARRATGLWTVTRTSPPTGVLTIPSGTEATIAGTSPPVRFRTTEALTLADGVLSGTVGAEAVDAGRSGNGWVAGTSLTLTAPISGVASVALATATSGGAEIEDDDHLRERILLAPESFSVAGPAGAYRYHALSAHRNVVDVSVMSPGPGRVTVTVLTDPLPVPQAVLDTVAAVLTGERVRPLTDQVTVQAAMSVSYAIDVRLTVLRGVLYPPVLEAARRAADDYAARLRRTLGADLVPAHLIAAMRAIPGVHDVAVIAPVAMPLDENQVAVVSSTPTITITGEVAG